MINELMTIHHEGLGLKVEGKTETLIDREKAGNRSGLTCCFQLVEAEADKAPASSLSGLGGGSADSQGQITGQAAAALHKAIKQAGQVEATPLSALLQALSWAGQEGPHPQPQMVDHAQWAPCNHRMHSLNLDIWTV